MSRPGRPTESSLLFEWNRVPYGDDSQVRGITARCGYCTNVQCLPVNQFRGGRAGHDDDKQIRYITRKLEDMGWKVGNTQRQHRCPDCFKKIKFAAKQKAREGEMTKDNVVPIAPEQPRQMTREDRRIIFGKLETVYVDEKVGYGDGWTDIKVATDLGVPAAWVKQIREENFGDEQTSEHIRKVLSDAVQACSDAKALGFSIEKSMEEFRKKTAIVDKLAKSVAEVQSILGRK